MKKILSRNNGNEFCDEPGPSTDFMVSPPPAGCNLSGTPEKFLNLFGMDGMLDIGDEVTVPSSTLSFPTNSDHSYFSLSGGPSSMGFDCMSESSLPEFHDLFQDLSSAEYPPFDMIRMDTAAAGPIGLQEQVIDSNHSVGDVSCSFDEATSPQQREDRHAWSLCGKDYGDLGESGAESNDNDDPMEMDTSSSSDSEQGLSSNEKSEGSNNNKNNKRKTKRSKKGKHHTGPFPHTFIPTPGDRRIRFCFGLQTIVTKIKALMSRTGAKADFKAEFEGHTFTLDNAEKLLKSSGRSQKTKRLGDGKSSPTPSSSGQGADDDHRYAATILTQSESSTIKDHQYNDVSTTNAEENNKKKTVRGPKPAFIRTRYARERWLRKCATTIYSKMQRLINRTGAKMSLTIEYQNLLVTPKNYKELDHLLGNNRPAMKKFNTKIIIEKKCNNNSISSDECQVPSSSGSETVMKVSFPSSRKGVHVELIGALKNRNLQTIIESDHDYDSSQHSTTTLLSPKNFTSERFSPTTSLSSGTCSIPELSLLSDAEIQIPNPYSFPGDDDTSELLVTPEFSLCAEDDGAAPVLSFINDGEVTIDKNDASTMTEPTCEICRKSQSSGEETIKFPSWIRCSNPLCHYLVHPACIGFFIMNPQHLQLLPPYFCPSHRAVY